jgi:hypothetical protein
MPAFAGAPGQDMAAAADKLLSALAPEQKERAVFQFNDEQRVDWHFIPKARKGLPFKEMTPEQREAAHALLQTALSASGLTKATNIMSLEYVLFERESQSPRRDAGLYYVTIFGKPGTDVWGWRLEGHHLSLNFVVLAGKVLSVTPSFFGADPAQVLQGPRKGLQPLGKEEDLARELVKALDPEQRKTAVLSAEAPRDIITGSSRKAKALEPMGIPSAKLTESQRAILLNLLKEYVFRYRDEIADDDLRKIRQHGEDKLYFAWAGGTEPGQGHYYRIQGPTFLMEFDNTQNQANHIHTVWRDLENDFGDDVLRRHYERTPHPK